MPAWVMTSKRDGPDISFYIGAVKVANIHMTGRGQRVYLRFMDNDPEGDSFDTVSNAMIEMHKQLKAPRNEA